MDWNNFCKENGFKDKEEFFRLTCKVDISTDEKMANFKWWQFNDGTKEGLLKVINANNPSSLSD